ncbi:hypothetical protein [Ornithinimicrobium panacihumi]|uniref:hypothetical protein n=1 Tax=Ornithinimicrobium panacihumi TaxID=2008449 RepID=UPI003F8A1865
MSARHPLRLAPLLLLPGGLALLAGMDAALTLAGLPAPAGSTRLAVLHGPLMVLGFLGTVISLERAVALRRPWGLLAPGLIGLGALALVALPDPLLGRLLLIQGFLLFVAVYAVLLRRNHDLTVAVQLLGASLGTCAAVLLTRLPVPDVIALLISFVVLTIGAERVELARLAMPRGSDALLTWWAAGVTAAALAEVLWPDVGWRLLGLVLLGLTLWLLRHDVARRLVRAKGLPRFSAAALLLGYAWLLVAAIGMIGMGRPTGGTYDIVVHATFLGFAMSMILAHAPVILPAVLRVRLPYSPWMYLALLVLHLTLTVRVLAVALGRLDVWSGALYGNVAAILVFLLTSITAAVVAATRRRRHPIPATAPARGNTHPRRHEPTPTLTKKSDA